MLTTLEALHRAVVASPEDHTVRLAYADALDETGEKADAVRAEFIRTQIKLQSVPEPERRPYELSIQCREFEANWLAWWRPVADAAGLPAPHVPSRRLRDRVTRRIRSVVQEEPRPANWPYTHTASDGNIAVHLADYGMSFRFDSGFPEELRFHHMDPPENQAELVHRWGDAMPLVRLAITHSITPVQWERLDGTHLARLPELTFDRLLPDTTMLVAASPHLAALTRLRVNPVPTATDATNTDTVRFLVHSPTWAGLRSLHFTGRLTPNLVRDLATLCTLENLEELELFIGNPNILGGAVAQALNEVLRRFLQSFPIEGMTPIRWVDYGPPLEALAAAAWVRKLRRLRITSDHPNGLMGMLGERLYGSGERAADLIPDPAVYSLVNAIDSDRLEKLVLPGGIISPSIKEDLMSRLGDRVTFG